MLSNAPTVMVSSTFYDLQQISTELSIFFEQELGYRTLLSEHHSFPIDPDADTVEDCRRRVEQDADVLVLVIGGRYGYLDEASDKSVTNLEYLTAKAKGIPIYAFVDSGVLSILPVWENNKDGDFSKVVDDVRLFSFVQRIRKGDRLWTTGFEKVQNITDSLRIQFAHQMIEGLQWRNKLYSTAVGDLQGMHGKALRLALERPEAWEYRLFGQLLCDEVESSRELRMAHKNNVVLNSSVYLSSEDIHQWIQTQSHELSNLTVSLSNLIDNALWEAVQKADAPVDVWEIAFIARQLGVGYRHAIEWSQGVRRIRVEDEYKKLFEIMSHWTDKIIESLESFGPDFLQRVNEALEAPEGEDQKFVGASLEFEVSHIEEYFEEFERLFGDH